MTLSGRTCKKWSDQDKYPMGGNLGNHNYCRNPSGEKDKPWCYTVDPAKEWEFCEVPECAKEAAAPKPWTAPDGAKSKGSKPCEYKPPNNPGFKLFEADRSCSDNRGDTWW